MLQKSAKELVAEASKQIETLAADDAVKLADDPNVVFVDVRLESRALLLAAVTADTIPHCPQCGEPVTHGLK